MRVSPPQANNGREPFRTVSKPNRVSLGATLAFKEPHSRPSSDQCCDRLWLTIADHRQRPKIRGAMVPLCGGFAALAVLRGATDRLLPMRYLDTDRNLLRVNSFEFCEVIWSRRPDLNG